MKKWNVVYEQIMSLRVEDGKVIALIHQYVRDEDRQGELREFSACAPALTVEG